MLFRSANTVEQRDERTYEQLKGGVWSGLQLTRGLGAQDKIDAARLTLQSLKQHEYQTYWTYRSAQSNPAVYDPDFQVRLSASEVTYYTDLYGAGAATAVATLEASRTQQYHDLHAVYGAIVDSQASPGSYVYELSAAEAQALTASIKIWTEEELLYSVNDGPAQAGHRHHSVD